MNNKKGFISIAVIYSMFFAILITLTVTLSNLYNKRIRYNIVKENIKYELANKDTLK